MIPEFPATEFNNTLRRWFRGNGRKLPWRPHPSAYEVLVSEFMLQQTTVTAVIPYFQRWMQRFPNIHALASATESDVLKHWEGLGYYSRARNLHRAAQVVDKKFSGHIPANLSLLRTLPGIGAYTAAAIAAFAYDQCLPVLDANIARVVARLFNFQDNITTSSGRKFLEQAAASLLPRSGGRCHASALMDLGATICRAGEPDCPACPLQKFCLAENPAALPVKPPKKEITHLTDWRIFASTDEMVYLIESAGPTWKGLWLLPPGNPSDIPLLSLAYTITRYKVTLGVSAANPEAGWTAFPISKLPAMPSPHRKALAAILNTGAKKES